MVARPSSPIPSCERVRALLSERTADGTIPFHPYRAKWYGAHWVLVARLLEAQWPDGGWNCDRRAGGRAASFTESRVPLRALAVQHAAA